MMSTPKGKKANDVNQTLTYASSYQLGPTLAAALASKYTCGVSSCKGSASQAARAIQTSVPLLSFEDTRLFGVVCKQALPQPFQ